MKSYRYIYSKSWLPFLFMGILLQFAVLNMNAQRFGSFPYEESFLKGDPGNISFPASQISGVPNSADFTDEGLLLTPNIKTSFGAVFINDRRFTSVNGIRVEFEYMAYGSTGAGGDGINMFLLDAKVKNPTIGAHGAGIGYAYNRSYNGILKEIDHRKSRMKGLSGAYLGVAFDEFGNYKGLRFQGDSRVGGIPYNGTIQGTTRGMIGSEYNTRNQVTLRGAKGPVIDASLGLGDGYTGYPVLITQATNDRNGVEIMPYETNKSIYKTFSTYTGNLFTISGGDRFTDDSNEAYRKAIVELYPVPDDQPVGGFYVTVKIQHGKKTDVLISDYHYKETFWYAENAYPNGGQGDNNSTDIIRLEPVYRQLNAHIPDTLRIGFAASTGEETNYHIIKNLRITLPGGAEAYDDYAETDQGKVITILPLDNDLAYNGTIKRDQIGNRDYLVDATFRFRDVQNKIVPGYTYTNPNEGTWTYDPFFAKVTFMPKPSFYGDAKVDYDIKGGKYTIDPYLDEAYRSLPATITVQVNQNPARDIISNKMVTMDLE